MNGDVNDVAGVWSRAVWYVVERALRLSLGALAGVFVARYLGVENFGVLAFVSSTFALAATWSQLGFRQILVTEFSGTSGSSALLSTALILQASTGLVVGAGVLLLVSQIVSADDAILLAISIAPISVLAASDTIRAVSEARLYTSHVLTANAVSGLLAFALSIAAVLASWPLWVFGAVVTLEYAAVGAILIANRALRELLSRGQFGFDRKIAKRLLMDSWPLLLQLIAVTVYMKSDIVMLGIMRPVADTGLYSAAARVSEVWYFVPVAAMAAIRPKLAQLHHRRDTLGYESLTQRSLTSGLAISVVVAFVTFVGASQIIGVLYGESFAAASAILRIHILASPFIFLGVAASQWFIDHSATRIALAWAGIGAFVNVGLNVALIPHFGPVGAAVATVVAYALSGVILNATSRRTSEILRLQLRAWRGAWH